MLRSLLGLAALVAVQQVPADWMQPHWVMFEPNSYAVDAEAASKLQRFALDVGDRHLVIRGHADGSEVSEAQGVDLSRRRALVVFEHLQAYGVSPALMRVEGLGASRQAGEDIRRNRSVEIVSAVSDR